MSILNWAPNSLEELDRYHRLLQPNALRNEAILLAAVRELLVEVVSLRQRVDELEKGR